MQTALGFWGEPGSASRGALAPQAGVVGRGEFDAARTESIAYRAAGLHAQETYAWRPPLTSGESATLYDRTLAAARADDLVRNDPHAHAGVTRLVDMLVGAGLRVSPKPNARALGLDPTDETQRGVLKDLALRLKSEWSLFGEDPRFFNDAQRRRSFNGQLRLMAGTWFRRGETTAFLDWRPDPLVRYATCVRVIDPDRVSNPMGQPDTISLRGGIEYDERGTPLAYHVRNGHPADWFRFAQLLKWTRIARATPWGRPIFVHGFESDREDQSRAVTPFASLMTRLRMITKHGDLEIATAAANAVFTAFVSSNMPLADATQAFTPGASTFATDRIDHYLQNPPTLNGVRIPVMAIGDEIKMNSSPRQTTSYAAFQTAFLQSIAAALGISYEQLAMDWSKVNYSSARAALNEVWRHVTRELAAFVEQVVIPIYYGVVEEAFDRGYIVAPKGAPDFYDMPGAYLGGRWIGPGRGYVDPVKEAQAGGLRMANFTSTLEDECAELGRDWEDNLDQLAIEEEEIESRGLVRALASSGTIAPDPSDDPDGADTSEREKQAA